MAGPKTAGVINGTDFLLYIDATHPIGLSTNCSLQLTTEMRDTSNKDVPGWDSSLPGKKKYTLSCDALMAFDLSYNLIYLTGIQINRTLVNWSCKTSNTSNEAFSGTAWITSIQANMPHEGNVTFSISFQGTGTLTAA
jgi:TP901-1 family phage major tail protein